MNVWIWHIYEIALRGTSRLRLNHPTSWYIHIIHSMPTSRKVWLHYGNGLRSPMKLRKARHLRRCDRPGRCRPSWPLQEPWRSHQIHPSKKGGPGWVAVSNMLVKGGVPWGGMRWCPSWYQWEEIIETENEKPPPPFLVQHFLLRAAHQHLQGSIPEPQLDSVGLNSCAIQWLQKLGTILAS